MTEHALAVGVADAEGELCEGDALLGGPLVLLHRLGVVLRETLPHSVAEAERRLRRGAPLRGAAVLGCLGGAVTRGAALFGAHLI
jgi:hypothetical protein